MRLAIAATVVVVLGFATHAAAQGDQVAPRLELGIPSLDGGQHIPVEAANGTTFDVPWTYTFPAAAIPAEGTTIAWSLDCTPTLAWQASPTEITFAAGQQEYAGTASFPISASRDIPALQDIPCSVTGTAGAATESLQASDTTEPFSLSVAYVGNVTVSAPVSDRQAGPQKNIAYSILIENHGNARTHVDFEIVGDVSGDWMVILPSAMVLESPATGLSPTSGTAFVTVSTPYENGPNSGSAEFVVRVRTKAAADESAMGPSVDVPLKATVKGLYVPGPSLGLLVAALAAAAFVRTRH